MVITDFLERNSRLYGLDTALVVVSPSEKRDQAVTWREASLIESATDSPYRREMNWRQFDQMANRFGNLLLSREIPRGTKVGILMMNCLEYLPIYFGVLKAGCIVVPMNYRYSSDEIKYCLDLADVEKQYPEGKDPLLCRKGRPLIHRELSESHELHVQRGTAD